MREIKTISRAEAISAIARAREAVCRPEELENLLEDCHAASVHEALLCKYAGVTNGFLSQIYEAISGARAEVIGEPEFRFRCPCCHRQTLDEIFDPEQGTGWDICDHCGWEDDSTTDETQHSGCNRGSMSEYRERMRARPNYYNRDKWRE